MRPCAPPAHTAHTPAHIAAHSEAPPEPPSVPRQRGTPNLDRGEETLSRANRLARQHMRAIGEQIDNAEHAANVGLAILDHVQVLLAGPGFGGENEGQYRMSQRVLAAVSPDRETMSSLVKAALALIEGGTRLKRLALGMDVIKGGTPALGLNTQPPNEVLKRLSPEALLSLRKAALEVSRLPPPMVAVEGEVA